jgi:hypothetical protein
LFQSTLVAVPFSMMIGMVTFLISVFKSLRVETQWRCIYSSCDSE